MSIKVYRHGDLLLSEDLEKKETQTKRKENGCILEGEVTGHHHKASDTAVVEITEENTADNDYYRGYVSVPEKPETITHEEHDEIELQPGEYTAWIQREYDPIEERRVRD